jgi:voltage-gated potassium channel
VDSLMPKRGTIAHFIAEHELQWEIAMGVLTALYVVLAFMEDEIVPGLNAQTIAVLIVAGVFLAEFCIRLWDSPSRLAYVRGHWLDLVTCIPLIGALRVLRFARLLRFLRIASLVRAFMVGRDVGSEGRRAYAGWLLGPTLLIFWAASAYGFWLVEHGHNPSITNLGDALYLSFLTATTLGYGDVRPVTPEGKIIAGFVIFAAIGLVGFASSQLTALWLGQEEDVGSVKRRLFSVQKELAVQRNMLEQILGHVQPGTDGDRLAEAEDPAAEGSGATSAG